MGQSNPDSGPLHHAAVHVAAMCLLGWLTMLWSQHRISDASGGVKARVTEPVQADQLLKIWLNDASASELKLLPNIGTNMADRILRYRQQNGDFESWSDVQKIAGMGPSTIHAIKPYCELVNVAARRAQSGRRNLVENH